MYYSQVARPYAMFLFLALCSTYLFLLAVREGHRFAWVGFLCLAVAMIYTHSYGVFVLLAAFLGQNRRTVDPASACCSSPAS